MKFFVRLAACFVFASLPIAACTSGEVDDLAPPLGGANAPGSGAGATSGLAGNAGALAAAGTPGAAGAASSTAGASASGGASGAGTSQGGSTSQGGAPTVNCTDAPPNNGDTCAHAVEYGWCTQSWIGDSCQKSCGKCSAGSAGSTGSGGATQGGGGATQGGAGAPPVITDGTPGWASRYWDCCKPACGWKGNVPGGSTPVSSCSMTNQSFGGDHDQKSSCPNGNNGSAFMCWNFGPWAVSDNLAYGFAAISKGGDYCGRCYQLQFTGKSHNASVDTGSAGLAGKTMIVQAINNGGVEGNQFDLLIPGGGVGDFNACATQWGTSSLGEQYGGFFLACQKANGFDYAKSKACAAAKCQSVFAGKPDLLASCNWFTGWFGAPDNPALVYKEVTCPAAITSVSGLHR